MPKVRVLLVSGSHPPLRCGVGDYTATLAATLRAKVGIEVGVLTSAGAIAPNRSQVVLIPSMRNWGFAGLANFVRAINHFAPDIVHIQYPTQGYRRNRMPWLMPWAARLLGCRVVVTWHELESSSIKGALVAMTALSASAIIVVRGNFREVMPITMRLIAGFRPIRFIPNASTIPMARLGQEETAAERNRYGVLPGSRLVLFFGFLMASKGVEQLFAIADPNRDRLVIIGSSPDGDDCQRRLQMRAEEPDWRGRVCFPGFLPGEAVGRLLAAADAVVLPFRQGAGHWNTSVHAVQANGTFLVTTSRTLLGDDPSTNTWWCQPDDVIGMRKALTAGIGRKIPARASNDWQEIAHSHACIYTNALDSLI